MHKSQANRARIAARARKSEPNVAILTGGPLGCNLIARVERTGARPMGTGKNKAPKITTGQKHWDRPAHIGGTTALVMNDRRWSK